MSRHWLSVRLLLVLGTVALTLGVAELAIRLLQPVPPGELLPYPHHHTEIARTASGASYLQFDPEVGWSQQPSGRNVDDGIVFQANASGFRADREYTLQPAPDVVRLAAFGDSFTHCDEVSFEDCWTARLEEAWENAEVLNFGIPAAAPDQGWLRYSRDGRPFQPCAVLINFQVENVNRVVNRYRPFYSPETGLAMSKPRFVIDGDTLRLLPNPVSSMEQLSDPAWVEATLGPNDFWYYPGIFAPQPLDNLLLGRLARTALYQQHRKSIIGPTDNLHRNGTAYTPDDERFQVAGRVLIEFARAVRADGATPVVVVFGQHADVVSVRHREGKEHQPLLDWLEAEQISVIDVTSDLARAANRVGTGTLFAKNGHYSRRGNQVVSDVLAEKLPSLTAPTCR